MNKHFFVTLVCIICFATGYCEIPSNFNNQHMIINRIEENIEIIKSLVKNITENPADTPQFRSDLVSNVMKKERCVDEISDILCKELLQKYILSTDKEVNLKLSVIHKMLNLCYILKTSVDLEYVDSLETELQQLKDQLKLNYQMNPDYKSGKYRKYKNASKGRFDNK